MELAIIDYGMGNLRSVENACDALGYSARVTNNPEDLRTTDKIILPGVGAFGDGMDLLRRGGWIPVLEEEVRVKGKPFLGLCLGMQLLATKGYEHGTYEGLNWISGAVDRIQSDDPSLRIPHIGWNDVRVIKEDGLYKDHAKETTFYFLHSFAFKPDDPATVSGTCLYGMEFAASVEVDNIYAAQYHPEKSQKCGLAVLKNFLSAGE